MKSVKTASLFLIALICAISINSLYIINITNELYDGLETASDEDYKLLAEKFQKHERFISLTVSHDDLTNVEEAFAELIGASNAGDNAKLETTKSRLKDSLKHLGRLSGINIDSIL